MLPSPEQAKLEAENADLAVASAKD